MIVGSESSRFWVVKLNRSYDAAGLVQVAPEVVFTDEAWDEQVIADNGGDQHASVESSVTVVDDVAYFGTSAGLVLGYDLAGLEDGAHPAAGLPLLHGRRQRRVLVADDEGCSTPPPRTTARTTRAPRRWASSRSSTRRKPDNPIVWSFQETTAKGQGIYGTPGGRRRHRVSSPARRAGSSASTATPARCSGSARWAAPAWGSPVVVDDVLLIGDC